MVSVTVVHEPVVHERCAAGARSAGRGQGLVEYGIIIGLSVLLMAVLLFFFDDQVAAVLHWLTNQLP